MEKINKHPEIQCPIDKAYEQPSYDLKWLVQLTNYLDENKKSDQLQKFPIGTVDKNGVLDCCKQGLGSLGTKKIANHLSQNTFVNSILLGTNGLGNKGAKVVAELVRKNQTLETIYLGCNRIEGEGVQELAAALTHNSNIKGLWLKRNPIGQQGFRAIAQLLKEHKSLRTLDLVHTLPDLEALTLLVDSLVQNQGIKRLFLGGNSLDVEAVQELQRLLTHHKVLESLYLNVNNLANQGTVALAVGLENSNIQELSIASNGIGLQGFQALFEVLPSCSQLKYLDIGYSTSTQKLGAKANQLGDEGAKLLGAYLAKNKTIVEVKLNKNGLSNRGLQYLIDAMEQNQTVQRLTIGKGFHKKAKAKLKNRLTNNRTKGILPSFEPHQDVQLIRSVYR